MIARKLLRQSSQLVGSIRSLSVKAPMLNSPLSHDSVVVASSSKRARALSPATAARLATQAYNGPAKVMTDADDAVAGHALCTLGCKTTTHETPMCPYPSTAFPHTAALATEAAATEAEREPSVEEMLAALRGHVIEVEGNIGSGKSTLTNNLSRFAQAEATAVALAQAATDGAATVEEEYSVVHGEKVNAVFLKAFYENLTQYAFAFQMYMLTTRLYQIDEASRQAHKENKLVFLDRGAVGDVLFALQNYKIGNMSKQDMAVYKSVCSERLPASLSDKVDAVVYLDVAPETCWYRMTTVRQREAEEGVPLAYLDGIDSVYFHLLVDWLAARKGGFHDMNIGSAPPVMVVRWERFGCHKAVLRQLYELLQGRRKSPTVAFTTDASVPVSESVDLVIESEEQVQAAAAALKEHDALTVTCAASGAAREVRSVALKWGLEHSAAFRKVAMHVLSEQGHVLFYGKDTEVETPEYNCAK